MFGTSKLYRRLTAWLFGPPGPSPLDLARRRQEVARLAYRDAVKRKDTRDIHWAEKHLERATRTVMAIEMGWA